VTEIIPTITPWFFKVRLSSTSFWFMQVFCTSLGCEGSVIFQMKHKAYLTSHLSLVSVYTIYNMLFYLFVLLKNISKISA